MQLSFLTIEQCRKYATNRSEFNNSRNSGQSDQFSPIA